MRILITNDDGIQAEGLRALAAAMMSVGEVFVVAPSTERSGTSHSLTLTSPLRAQKLDNGWYSVDGTPTDCVLLATYELLDRMPDLLISGINHGTNMGEDVTYSGTVAAAFEGAILGIPSVAVSLVARSEFHFEAACDFTIKLTKAISDYGLPADTLLNVNVPNLPPESIAGYKITKLGKRSYSDVIVRKEDPRGGVYYWIGGKGPYWVGDEDTDYNVVSRGFISVTPLNLDMTNYGALSTLRSWRINFDSGRRL